MDFDEDELEFNEDFYMSDYITEDTIRDRMDSEAEKPLDEINIEKIDFYTDVLIERYERQRKPSLRILSKDEVDMYVEGFGTLRITF